MKKAFTMLELVFVIVVIGILAALILPRTKTNPVQESAVDLLSKIRYTQHLALVDDKYGENSPGTTDWYEKRWQIIFNANKYSISTKDRSGTQKFAVNPSNRDSNLSNVNLNDKYNVTVVLGGTDCIGQNIISFDYLGRPMVGSLATGSPYSAGQLIQGTCNIVLSDGTESATISIAPETGYAKITF